jgi:hypothetical protein
LETLTHFNLRLHTPISANELRKTIRSAYSGTYQAASRTFIIPLLQQWVSSDLTAKDLFGKQIWVKTQQPRTSRKNSFLSEWKTDLTAFLLHHTSAESPYLQTTQSRISDVLGIPARSLAKLLKLMQAAGEITLRTRRGRNGGLSIAHRNVLASAFIQAKQAQAKDFFYRVIAIMADMPVRSARRNKPSGFRYVTIREYLHIHPYSGTPGAG